MRWPRHRSSRRRRRREAPRQRALLRSARRRFLQSCKGSWPSPRYTSTASHHTLLVLFQVQAIIYIQRAHEVNTDIALPTTVIAMPGQFGMLVICNSERGPSLA